VKSCYGGYCVTHKAGRDFSTIGPSPFKTFLVVVVVVAILFVVTEVFY